MKNKILFVSDNHGIDNISYLKEKEQCQYAFHIGDSQFSHDSQEMSSFEKKVQGNCDIDQNYPVEATIKLENIGILYLTHGHLNNVRTSTFELESYCQKNEVKICAYGHTHIVDYKYFEKDDLLIINPGSTSYSRSLYPETYIVLKYSGQEYEILIKRIKNNKTIEKVKYFRKNSKKI